METPSPDAPFVPPTHCPACGAEFGGPWCQACGERRLTGRLRLGQFLHEWASATFGLERGFLRTLVGMLRRPGETVREYLGGMRRTHCSPMRFFLWLMLGVVLVMALVDWVLPPDFTDPFMGMTPRFVSDFAKEQQVGELFTMNDAQRERHYRLSMRGTQINALLLPMFFAFASRWTFRRANRTYTEHLVVALYLFAMLAPTMVLWWVLVRTGPWWDWLVILPVSWGYAGWVTKQVYGEPYVEAMGRALGSYVIATFCAMPFLFIYQLVVMLD